MTQGPTPSGTPETSLPELTATASHRLGCLSAHVLRSLPVGVITFDRDLRVRDSNPSADALIAAEGSLAESLERATVDAQYEAWDQELRKVLASGQTARFNSITVRRDGEQDLLVNLSCIALTDETDGAIIGGLLVLEDVTLQASMERRLAISERLAAVGKLAARVAHELNNPLDGILRYINLALRVTQETDDDRVERYLTESRKGLLRMTQIIRELLQFSRASPSDFEPTTVNELVDQAVKALSAEASAGQVTIVMSLHERMPPLHAGSLFQVFCNLTKNAIDAMSDGGTLTISTQQLDGCVVVRFEDTGPGLPKDIPRVFEPFFTTKEQGKGTGLGLAVSRDIVERFNGQITASNRPEGGAVFEVRVPLSSCAAGPAAPPDRPARGITG